MKEILLVPGPALSSKIEIEVMDFPNGLPEGGSLQEAARKRCKITVEYGRPDVLALKNQGLDLEGALDHYRKYIYDLVKFHILSEWTAVDGLDEVMSIIREKVMLYI